MIKNTEKYPFDLLIDETMQDVMWQVAQIRMQRCNYHEMSNDNLCTVYTKFDGEYDILLAFCADDALMKHLAESMLGEPVSDPEELNECLIEFLNIFCGHVVSSIFREQKISARFQVPCIAENAHIPIDEDKVIAICYTNTTSPENAMLLHGQLS